MHETCTSLGGTGNVGEFGLGLVLNIFLSKSQTHNGLRFIKNAAVNTDLTNNILEHLFQTITILQLPKKCRLLCSATPFYSEVHANDVRDSIPFLANMIETY